MNFDEMLIQTANPIDLSCKTEHLTKYIDIENVVLNAFS